MKSDLFKVVEIIDKERIKVSPLWAWNNKTGSIVNISQQLKINNEFFLKRLKTLLDNKEIELKNPIKADESSVHCYVFLDGINIKNYFPELQPH